MNKVWASIAALIGITLNWIFRQKEPFYAGKPLRRAQMVRPLTATLLPGCQARPAKKVAKTHTTDRQDANLVTFFCFSHFKAL
jgi:hypothetical protein